MLGLNTEKMFQRNGKYIRIINKEKKNAIPNRKSNSNK